MSFDTLKVAELKEVAEEFAVDLEGATKKADIVVALDEFGVTWDDYEALLARREAGKESAEKMFEKPNTPKPEKKAFRPTAELVLVKMDRANPMYEANGFMFTREHPFVPMTEDQAMDLFDLEPEGFRFATPREAQEYYS